MKFAWKPKTTTLFEHENQISISAEKKNFKEYEEH
jgi:hypothetical protein